MTEVVYLSAGEQMPEIREDQPWVFVEADPTDMFYGSGGAWKRTGEWVAYGSLAEHDVSAERALAAALAWAVKYSVPTIWVQIEPWQRVGA